MSFQGRTGCVCVLALAAACGDDAAVAAQPGTSSGGAQTVGSSSGAPPALDPNADPCRDADLWPEAIHSDVIPVWVHFRSGEEPDAARVLELVEASWSVEVGELGFRPPPADAADCGPDDDFDVFLWPGSDETYVASIAEIDATSHDDRSVYMVVDPGGPYGGDLLPVTVAHELNHACQAADDWWDAPIVYEMTAVFVEDLVYDDADDYLMTLPDFQRHPHWSLDRDDGYETWFMYGSALYLHFVREQLLAGDPGFAARMWLGMRNPPGDNEPDFADALDELLEVEAGVGFIESIPAFARWRYYTGERDDGVHFSEAAGVSPVPLAGTLAPGEVVALSVEMLGTSYVELTGSRGGVAVVDLHPAPGVRWVAQAVPGLGADDGELVDLSAGPTAVQLDGGGRRTLVLTVVPTGTDDPDDRTAARHQALVRLGT